MLVPQEPPSLFTGLRKERRQTTGLSKGEFWTNTRLVVWEDFQFEKIVLPV